MSRGQAHMSSKSPLSPFPGNSSAVVTGSASGIGRKIALALAESGCRVTACDINTSGLDALADEARRAGLDIAPRPLDITRVEDIQGFTDQLHGNSPRSGGRG